jgi:hypothetical protein
MICTTTSNGSHLLSRSAIKDYRHGYLRGFPYRVVYLVEGEAIYVYQVRHTRRNVDPEFGP